MKTKSILLLLLIAAALTVSSCRSRTDRSEGTVLLSVSDFNGLPISISLGDGNAPFIVEEIELRNIAKDPNGTTSDLMDIELRSYEVRYRRRDTGTRVPPPTVQGLFGIVPVGGTTDLENVPFLFTDQLQNPPLKDLVDFGRDTETGTAVVVLDVSLRFFGRTLSGDDIVSDPATFTIEVRP
ncbi:MAG TPA: hypothetical protein VF789_12135 [Thermoanaerobaculia bacterium]